MTIAQQISAPLPAEEDLLPERFRTWFASRGWSARPHQLALIARAAQGKSVLLVAPTGGGKTLAGFLPSLIELAALPARRPRELHTLYISPLKALAVDVARNLETPVAEMGLPVRIETRTGDTPASRRQRQKTLPPDILLTTPEQLALLIASREAPRLFKHLRAVVLDELHAMNNTKRGDLLALGLARLRTLAPEHRSVGLSATVADPAAADGLPRARKRARRGAAGARPEISNPRLRRLCAVGGTSSPGTRSPTSWTAIKKARTSLVFVNTRARPSARSRNSGG